MGYLIIVAVIVFLFRLPSVRGFFGELAIRIWLKFLDKKRYKGIMRSESRCLLGR